MSLGAFQSALARLIIDPDFRDAVREHGEAALEGDLEALERSRLRRIAADRGLDINRTLHKGFRLGKLRAMLPLTCNLLGSSRLARQASDFWCRRAPSSFYFIPEAIEFCDFLAAQRLKVKYLREVLAWERATLELERARTGLPEPQRVQFEHDPAPLLGTLGQGRRPRGIRPRRCLAVGERDPGGAVRWQLCDLPSPPA